MMDKFLKRFSRFLLFLSVPFVLALAGYLYFDPFKVLYSYNDYSYPFVVPNRDNVSTETFVRNYNEHRYDSFIFGSSRTIAFQTSSWKEYLPKSSSPFMFDASVESVYGIYKKIKYLDSTKVKINNVIIILCRDYSFSRDDNSTGHLYIKSPITSGESKLDFQMEFFKAYLAPKFIFDFYVYKIGKKYRPFMEGVIEFRKVTYDTVSNQMNILDQEEEITKNPEQYYSKRKDLFYERKSEHIDSVTRITGENLKMLREIKQLFQKNKTNYKVVLSPLYEQIKFSVKDRAVLQDIFGKNLYDFSGKNDFTDVKTNYYETSHYRPLVGNQILKMMYQKDK